MATQDPQLMVGLDVNDKTLRVTNYHRETLKTVAELIGPMGLSGTPPAAFARPLAAAQAETFAARS